MSLAGQQLLRCPHCISVQPRGPGGELLLNPGENTCANRNCGRTFLGHEAILEDYPRDGRRGAPRSGKPSDHQAGHPAPLQPTLFGRKK
jgi:hypothetical protein